MTWFASAMLGGLAACTDGVGKGQEEATPAFDLVEVEVWEGDSLPPGEPPRHALAGVAIGDLDGDGWLDALMAYAGGSFGLRNDGAGRLIAGGGFTLDGGPFPPAYAVSLGDLDGDGDLDGVLGRWGGLDDLLLWNDGGGRFLSEVLPDSGGATFTTTLADLDGDGDLDLARATGATFMVFDDILAGRQRGDPNTLHRNDGGGVFTPVPDAFPPGTEDGMTFQLSPLDADEDGDLDLYVANDAGPFVEPNLLLRNDGTGHFTRANDCECEVSMLAMGAAVGDANQDGRPDLYLTNVGPTYLLQGTGDGAFVDTSLVSGAGIPATPDSMISWGTAFVDLDADRDEDLVVTFGYGGDGKRLDVLDPTWVQGPAQPDRVLLSDGEGGFSRAPVPSFGDPSVTRAVAVGDLDRDGDPDLLTAGKHFLRQWRNEGGHRGRLTVRLHGRRDNPHGIGARLESTQAGVTRTSWMLPSVTGGTSAPEVYLGLGAAETLDALVVTWPDGSRSEREQVPAGVLDLVQGD
ncbi:MAG: hypothetical protein RLZZ299_2588 [Pseudomonadota bacterium]|jgi:hypothetical protein